MYGRSLARFWENGCAVLARVREESLFKLEGVFVRQIIKKGGRFSGVVFPGNTTLLRELSLFLFHFNNSCGSLFLINALLSYYLVA